MAALLRRAVVVVCDEPTCRIRGTYLGKDSREAWAEARRAGFWIGKAGSKDPERRFDTRRLAYCALHAIDHGKRKRKR